MTQQLGVILQGELYTRDGDSSLVRLFVDIDVDGDGAPVLHVRRAYGERNATLTLPLDDVQAALTLLQVEGQRHLDPGEAIAGQLALDGT